MFERFRQILQLFSIKDLKAGFKVLPIADWAGIPADAAGRIVQPGSGSVSITGNQAMVSRTANQSVAPGSGALTTGCAISPWIRTT